MIRMTSAHTVSTFWDKESTQVSAHALSLGVGNCVIHASLLLRAHPYERKSITGAETMGEF